MTFNNKVLKRVGIFNFLFFCLIVIYENIIKFKYLYITDILYAIKLFLFSFLPFFLVLIVSIILRNKKCEIISSKSKIKIFIVNFLFLSFSLLYLQIISFLYSDILESKTCEIENYMMFDSGLNDPDFDSSIFPEKISENATGIEYYYKYTTFDGAFLNSSYDIYLELVLPVDEYNQEKERIRENDNYYEILNGYYNNSSIEYIRLYNGIGIQNPQSTDYFEDYYFVAFFDEEKKIIYNMANCSIAFPHFIDINKNNIICYNDDECKITTIK